jgi:hypothetical protein
MGLVFVIYIHTWGLEIVDGVLELCDRVLVCTCVEMDAVITCEYGLFLLYGFADMVRCVHIDLMPVNICHDCNGELDRFIAACKQNLTARIHSPTDDCEGNEFEGMNRKVT